MLSIGIDPGSTTGYSLITSRSDLKEGYKVEYSGTIKGTSKDPIERADYISNVLNEIIGGNFKRLSLGGYIICIEGYGFSRVANIEPLFCIGTLIRYKLKVNKLVYNNIPPTSLKKFVTGKGNSGKDIMMKELYKRWKIDTNDNNESDAHGLALFGLALEGKIVVPKVNMSAVTTVRDNNGW